MNEMAPVTTLPFLSDAQRTLLRGVANWLVPANGNLPGAGDLDAGDVVEHSLGRTAAGRRLLTEGLLAIEVASVQKGIAFDNLSTNDQEAVLGAVEAAQPAFFVTLVDFTYRGYYVHPRVQAALGFVGAPAQPDGHALPVFDAALLARQRERVPFWRPTS